MEYTFARAAGNRGYMEDFSFKREDEFGTLLGVFDGHGGPEAAMWCARRALGQRGNVDLELFAQPDGSNIIAALLCTLRAAAEALRDYNSGTTASLAYIPKEENTIYTAVIGDSPIVIFEGPGGALHVGPDHNVRSNPYEAAAAIERGGYIDRGYVWAKNGMGLQMGRALGDRELRGILSTEPEIGQYDLFPGGFVLVGSDGLFDPTHAKSTMAEAVEMQRLILEEGSTACHLVSRALAIPTGDNVTALLAKF